VTDDPSSQNADGPDLDSGPFAAGDEDEDTRFRCPTCEAALERDEVRDHLAGRDPRRPECARQDIRAIAAREAGPVSRPIDARTPW
jgi:hypothetical protein